jgi:protein-S-isoprenylcysteine O-methyltransferase Ste14
VGFRNGWRRHGESSWLSPAATLRDTSRQSARTVIFVLVRALTYATLFVGLVLVFVPGRLLSAAGAALPARYGPLEIAGIVVGSAGALLAAWCVLVFAMHGRGTPAPFDAPRRLVVGGPYRFIRNPMYIGAGLALAGAALVYRSWALAGYLALFWLITHLFVIWYEEPTLRRLFGPEYEEYCLRVRRWRPRVRAEPQESRRSIGA